MDIISILLAKSKESDLSKKEKTQIFKNIKEKIKKDEKVFFLGFKKIFFASILITTLILGVVLFSQTKTKSPSFLIEQIYAKTSPIVVNMLFDKDAFVESKGYKKTRISINYGPAYENCKYARVLSGFGESNILITEWRDEKSNYYRVEERSKATGNLETLGILRENFMGEESNEFILYKGGDYAVRFSQNIFSKKDLIPTVLGMELSKGIRQLASGNLVADDSNLIRFINSQGTEIACTDDLYTAVSYLYASGGIELPLEKTISELVVSDPEQFKGNLNVYIKSISDENLLISYEIETESKDNLTDFEKSEILKKPEVEIIEGKNNFSLDVSNNYENLKDTPLDLQKSILYLLNVKSSKFTEYADTNIYIPEYLTDRKFYSETIEGEITYNLNYGYPKKYDEERIKPKYSVLYEDQSNSASQLFVYKNLSLEKFENKLPYDFNGGEFLSDLTVQIDSINYKGKLYKTSVNVDLCKSYSVIWEYDSKVFQLSVHQNLDQTLDVKELGEILKFQSYDAIKNQ